VNLRGALRESGLGAASGFPIHADRHTQVRTTEPLLTWLPMLTELLGLAGLRGRDRAGDGTGVLRSKNASANALGQRGLYCIELRNFSLQEIGYCHN
jgi:hypothetical protein